MKTKAIEDLKVNEVYNIRNGFAKNSDSLWFNNAVLLSIDSEWSMPTELTFALENGELIVIDGDFISENPNHYQII